MTASLAVRPATVRPVSLVLTAAVYEQILVHALDGYPLEACGLLVGTVDRPRSNVDAPPASAPRDEVVRVTRFVPSANLAASALVYTIDPKIHLRAERDADDDGLAIVGVMHSHTHTDPFPSPTDVRQAPDPSWHYVIVSLRDPAPALRSYRIEAETVTELAVTILA